MLQHHLVGLFPGVLGQLRVQGDVAAAELLERRADAADDASGAHGDPSHDAQAAHDARAVDHERRRDPAVVDGRLRCLLLSHIDGDLPR